MKDIVRYMTPKRRVAVVQILYDMREIGLEKATDLLKDPDGKDYSGDLKRNAADARVRTNGKHTD